MQQLKAELEKANEIIRKLQEDYRAAKSRAKTASAAAHQHERIAKETTESYEAARNELKQCRDALEKRANDLSLAEVDRRRLANEIKELRRQNEHLNTVTRHLSEQLAAAEQRTTSPRRLSPGSLTGKEPAVAVIGSDTF